MSKRHNVVLISAGLLLAALAVLRTANAAYAVPEANTGNGVIQSIDYLNHALVIKGHVYKVAPKARFIGASGFETLAEGMRVKFISDGPASSPASHVVTVVVEPPGEQP